MWQVYEQKQRDKGEERQADGCTALAEVEQPLFLPMVEPIKCPFLRIREVRLSVRNVACSDGTLHGGVHFPLMVKTHNIGTRSKQAEDRRLIRGKGTQRKDKKKFTTRQHEEEVCLYCGEEGHSVSECPKVDKDWKATTCPRCWHCGQPGHQGWECCDARERETERRRRAQTQVAPPDAGAGREVWADHYYEWKDNRWQWQRPTSHEQHAQFYSYTKKYSK